MIYLKSIKAVGGWRGWLEPGVEETDYWDSPATGLGISYREYVYVIDHSYLKCWVVPPAPDLFLWFISKVFQPKRITVLFLRRLIQLPKNQNKTNTTHTHTSGKLQANGLFMKVFSLRENLWGWGKKGMEVPCLSFRCKLI